MPFLRGTRYALMGGAQPYYSKVLATGPIAYWPLWETTGTVAQCLINPAQNGTYARNVAVMGTVEGPKGRTAPVFNGAADCVNIYSAIFNTMFSRTEGTLRVWSRVSAAGIWTDGNTYRPISITTDNDNRVNLQKNANNNEVDLRHVAGGTTRVKTLSPLSYTDWFCWDLTWSATANQTIAFINGVQQGVALAGPGAWVGALNNAQVVIGSASSVALTLPWPGALGQVTVWNRALPSTTLLTLYNAR